MNEDPQPSSREFKGISLFTRIVSIVLVVEGAIMLFFGVVQFPLNDWQLALLDVFLLAVFSTPLIYYFGIKPYVERTNAAIQSKEKSKQELSVLNKELELQKLTLDEHAIVSIANVKGDITYVNDKFCQISGYESDELLGQNHRILKSGEHPDAFFVNLWKTIANGQTWHGEVKNIAKSGDAYWVKTTIMPTLDEEGKPFQYISIRTDITDRKLVELQLEESREELESIVDELRSSKAQLEEQAVQMSELAEEQTTLSEQLRYQVNVKNKFFSIIAHDLKSPFNALLGMTDMMSSMSENISKEKMAEYAGITHQAAEKVFDLLQNLLTWSRMQMDDDNLKPSYISLNDIGNETMMHLEQIAKEKGITITNNIGNAMAFADYDMTKTVIRNLVANAIKFTPRQGRIELSSGSAEGQTLLTISDNGVGIPTRQRDKLFALDQKTSTTGTDGEPGTGLGLPLCKEMVERNGGRIWFESEEGKGTQFHVTLPANDL